MNLVKAIKAFWHILLHGEKQLSQAAAAVKPAEVGGSETIQRNKVAEKKAAKSEQEQFEAGAVYMLALLQREGRLVDFLMENIEAYDDGQIGAAVRRIHQSCGKTLQEYFHIKRIVDRQEGSAFTVDSRLDHTRIRLVGNVPDMVPFDGVIQHGGWEAGKIELPERNDSVDLKVVYPAEIGF